MSEGKNIEIKIVATGGSEAASEVKKVESAELSLQEQLNARRASGGSYGLASDVVTREDRVERGEAAAAENARRVAEIQRIREASKALGTDTINLKNEIHNLASQDGMAFSNDVNKHLEERNRVTRSVTMSSGQMRYAMQDLGYQVQDFAVQTQGGTSAIKSFAQQAPQALSAFGPWGVAIGTVISLGASLVPALMKMSFAAGETDERMEELANTKNKVIEATVKHTAAGKLETEEQAKATIRAREFNEAMREMLIDRDAINESIRQSIQLHREANQAANDIAKAKGDVEIEKETDPVRKEEVKNRLRKESQARELSQMAQEKEAKDALIKRLTDQEQSVTNATRGKRDELKEKAKGLDPEITQAENNLTLQKSNMDEAKKTAETAEPGVERSQAKTELEKFTKLAIDAETKVRELKALRNEYIKNAEAADSEGRKKADEAHSEANKLFQESEKIGRDIKTKTEVFSQHDALSEAIVDNKRKAAEKAEKDRNDREAQASADKSKLDSEKKAREAEAKERVHAQLETEASKIGKEAGTASGKLGLPASYKRDFEKLGAHIAQKGNDGQDAKDAETMMNMMNTLIKFAEQHGKSNNTNTQKLRELENKIETLTRQSRYK